MTRKYLFIIFLVIIVFSGALYFMFQNGTTNTDTIDGTATRRSGLASFFPFLGGGAQTPAVTPVATDDGFTEPEPVPVVQTGTSGLKQLSTRPVAGLTVLPALDTTTTTTDISSAKGETVTDEKLPRIRYVEQGTGTVYETTPNATTETRLTSTVIARSAHAVFANNGESVAIRFIKNDNTTIGTFLGKITRGSGVTGTLEGSFLPDNILDITASADGKSFGYIIGSESGSVGMTIRSDGSGRKQLFQNLLSEWLLDWKTGGITATSKAASGIAGYVYSISGNGVFQKIAGPVAGLTTNLAPSGKKLLYATATPTTLQLFIRTISSGVDTQVQLATLPEKCVWNAKSTYVYCGVPQNLFNREYPDAWYQGLVSFTDAIWKIDTATGLTTRITTGSEALIDATNLRLDPTEKFLVFINKNDGTVWSLDLEKTP